MKILTNPEGDDRKIISGESGVVTLGLLFQLLSDPDCQPVLEALQLNRQSKVLLISTEADTDPERHHRIVQRGGIIPS